MKVTDFTLNDDPLNYAARQVMQAFRGAVDTANRPLLYDVGFGMDEVLWDVFSGGKETPAENFPIVRVFYSNVERETDDGLMGFTRSLVPLWIYFVYYVGVPSQEPAPISFVEARENHIRACMETLRLDRMVPYKDATGGDIWRPVVQTIVEDHDTPLKYMSESFVLPPEFACSRVDYTMQVKGYISLPVT